MLPRLDYGILAQAFQLAAGNIGPGPGRIELQVRFPVLDGLERFADALAKQGQVEVRIGVLRM